MTDLADDIFDMAVETNRIMAAQYRKEYDREKAMMPKKPVGSLPMRCCGCDENFFPGDDVYAWHTGEEFCAGCYEAEDRPHHFQPPYPASDE